MYFSLSEISKRSGIPVRDLRYVVDHELGPFAEADLDEVAPGSARMFAAGGATLIICAARLRGAGVRREAIHYFLWTFGNVPFRKLRSKMDLFIGTLDFHTKGDFRILIADSTHIRCIAGKSDSDWLRVEDNKMTSDPKYVPTVVITANLHVIRQLFN